MDVKVCSWGQFDRIHGYGWCLGGNLEIIDRVQIQCGGSASLGMQGNQGLLLPTQENYRHAITASCLLIFGSSSPRIVC